DACASLGSLPVWQATTSAGDQRMEFRTSFYAGQRHGRPHNARREDGNGRRAAVTPFQAVVTRRDCARHLCGPILGSGAQLLPFRPVSFSIKRLSVLTVAGALRETQKCTRFLVEGFGLRCLSDGVRLR